MLNRASGHFIAETLVIGEIGKLLLNFVVAFVVASISSFSHNVFYPSIIKYTFLSNIYLFCCLLMLSIRTSLKMCHLVKNRSGSLEEEKLFVRSNFYFFPCKFAVDGQRFSKTRAYKHESRRLLDIESIYKYAWLHTWVVGYRSTIKVPLFARRAQPYRTVKMQDQIVRCFQTDPWS